jgi:zinc transport system substrate-binding protein
LGALFIIFATTARAEPPKVVVSLKPLHALAAAVMEGVGAPRLIVQGAASEHAYALRPSEAASIESADAIFWVGPMMESYLIRPLAALPKHARLVTLIDLPQLTLLPRRAGGTFERDDDAPAPGAGPDGHVWLDPQNARIMAQAMAQTLSAIDPAHAVLYAANEAKLDADLAALDAELRQRLAPLRAKPFIVFHDAYHYLEARYGLRVLGSITVDPSLAPSAQRLTAIRARIKDQGALCVFSEPQFEPRLLPVVIEGTAARTGVLDPLGSALAPGRDAYFTLMRNLASALEGCLAR